MSASQFPSLTAKLSEKRCTNCSSMMSLYALPAHYGKNVEIDVCMDCNAIWFDQWESSQLSPDGVVALFQLINERGGAASSANSKFGQGLRCVNCGDAMKLTNDRVKNTRFTYQACRHGHGRLTTFYNFLSEKQFIRELTLTERKKLAASVKQVKCSSCAAPVDLGKADACAYCRAPVSVFDRDAAKKAIDHYLQERQKQVPSFPQTDYGRGGEMGRGRHGNRWDSLSSADLAADLLFALGRAASRGLSGSAWALPAGVATGVASSTLLAESSSALSTDIGTSVLDSLGTAPESIGATMALPSATDALFAGSLAASNPLHSSTEPLAALPSATDALFGGGVDQLSSLASEAGNRALDIQGGVVSDTAVSAFDWVGESALDTASSASGGVVDLVSDGIGSLLSGLFD